MTLPVLDRAVFAGGLTQIAQLCGAYVRKTGQTGQTDQSIDNAHGFGATPGQKLTSCDPKLASAHQKLTSRTVQRLGPGAQVIGSRLRTSRPSGGAPQP
jgi:hypothetical protein